MGSFLKKDESYANKIDGNSDISTCDYLYSLSSVQDSWQSIKEVSVDEEKV